MSVETITQTPTKLSAPTAPEAAFKPVSKSNGTAEAEYGFWDFLDLINPLQHIPVINTLYREATGDTIKPEMKLAGGAALGGVFGFIASLADVIFEQETGKDIGSTMVASVFGSDDQDAPVQVAKTDSIPGSKPQASFSEIQSKISALDTSSTQVLALYGSSSIPIGKAAKAYEQADMHDYLQKTSLNAVF